MVVEINVTDNSGIFLNALDEQIEMALTAIGLTAEKNVKKEITKAVYNTPERGYKRTGLLRNSLTNEVRTSEKAVYIGTDVKYGKYVELGTAKMKPRPFLRPAVENHTDEYKKLAKEALSS